MDIEPLRLGHYRLFCLNADGTRKYSAILSVFNARRVGQAVRYYIAYPTALHIGLEAGNLIFPITATLYSAAGQVLCYDAVSPKADAFVLDLPTTKDNTIKFQLVDGTHRVLTTRMVSLSKE
jgi:hypothetical protein